MYIESTLRKMTESQVVDGLWVIQYEIKCFHYTNVLLWLFLSNLINCICIVSSFSKFLRVRYSVVFSNFRISQDSIIRIVFIWIQLYILLNFTKLVKHLWSKKQYNVFFSHYSKFTRKNEPKGYLLHCTGTWRHFITTVKYFSKVKFLLDQS